MSTEIENRLGRLRRKRGIAAAALAKFAGVTRQTIYAIEAGTYIPNTALALKLARAIEVPVEELFSLPQEPAAELPTAPVTLLPGSDPPQPGQPVQLCRVDRHTVASAPSPVRWYFPASDAVVVSSPSAGKTRVRMLHPGDDMRNRILIAGCDPAISVLSRHAHAAGVELVLAHRNSSQALDLLKLRRLHIAGTHLETNATEIARRFPKRSVAVFSYAVWEEGIVTVRGNPKSIRGVEDLANRRVEIVNREPGSGSRRLLDSHLNRLGIRPARLRGYGHEAPGHLPAAWQVLSGTADCCIATRAAARIFGLDFIPLATERYDLAIRRAYLDFPAVQTLLDVLGRSAFRRELETLGGYDTRNSGARVL